MFKNNFYIERERSNLTIISNPTIKKRENQQKNITRTSKQNHYTKTPITKF
ncbi:unnamed protein product, partial [Vitis vinifera]